MHALGDLAHPEKLTIDLLKPNPSLLDPSTSFLGYPSPSDLTLA